jgi:hypothetical protein
LCSPGSTYKLTRLGSSAGVFVPGPASVRTRARMMHRHVRVPQPASMLFTRLATHDTTQLMHALFCSTVDTRMTLLYCFKNIIRDVLSTGSKQSKCGIGSSISLPLRVAPAPRATRAATPLPRRAPPSSDLHSLPAPPPLPAAAGGAGREPARARRMAAAGLLSQWLRLRGGGSARRPRPQWRRGGRSGALATGSGCPRARSTARGGGDPAGGVSGLRCRRPGPPHGRIYARR